MSNISDPMMRSMMIDHNLAVAATNYQLVTAGNSIRRMEQRFPKLFEEFVTCEMIRVAYRHQPDLLKITGFTDEYVELLARVSEYLETVRETCFFHLNNLHSKTMEGYLKQLGDDKQTKYRDALALRTIIFLGRIDHLYNLLH